VSKTDFAFWLGIYASAVASVTALWSLFRELWIERPRIDVTPEEAWLVRVKGQTRPLLVKGEATLKTMGVPQSACTDVLTVIVRNRGRRDAAIETVNQVIEEGRGRVNVFGDLLPQTPFLVPAERSSTLVMGQTGGYKHGSLRLKRFFVVDGAGRVHPLRERYRQRLRRILLRPVIGPEMASELEGG
jgi:hypothetical protein